MKKFVLVGTEIEKKIFPKIYKLISKVSKLKFKYILLDMKDKLDYELLLENLKFGVYDGINIENDYDSEIQNSVDKLSEKSQIFSYSNNISYVDGKLIANNTDYNAVLELFIRNNINPINKNILIIGTTQLSKVAQQMLKDFRANAIFVLNNSDILVSNNHQIKYINKLEMQTLKNIDVIINTTTVGEYPLYDISPIDVSNMIETKYAIDMVYDPINTVFLMEYKEKGSITIDGLYAQVVKAVKSIALWLNDPTFYNYNLIDEVYDRLKKGGE